MVTKDNAPSKDDVKAEKAIKANSKATKASKTQKGEKADELKSEKATKANSMSTLANKTEKGEMADNIKASNSVNFVADKTMDVCSFCADMPESVCLSNMQDLYENLSDKIRLAFLRSAYPDYDTSMTDKDCLSALETNFDTEESDTQMELLEAGCSTYLQSYQSDEVVYAKRTYSSKNSYPFFFQKTKYTQPCNFLHNSLYF